MVLATIFVCTLFLAAIWCWSFIWSSVTVGKVSVEVGFDKEIANQGDDVHLRCLVTNRSRFPCPEVTCLVELSEHLKSNDEDHPTFAKFTTHLGPRQQVIALVRVRAVRRGVGRATRVHLRLGDGLALRAVRKSSPVESMVVIRPMSRLITQIAPQMHDLMGDIRVQRFFNEDPSLLQNIRPYMTGDPIKYVSWLSTARTGQLMVREFGYTTTARCLIALSGDIYARRSRDVFDRLCECALDIMDQLLSQGFEVGLLANAVNGLTPDFYDPPSASAAQRERIRNRLGALEPIPKLPFSEFLNVVPRYAHSGDLVIILTSDLQTSGRVAVELLHRQLSGLALYTVSDSGRHVASFQFSTYIEQI